MRLSYSLARSRWFLRASLWWTSRPRIEGPTSNNTVAAIRSRIHNLPWPACNSRTQRVFTKAFLYKRSKTTLSMSSYRRATTTRFTSRLLYQRRRGRWATLRLLVSTRRWHPSTPPQIPTHRAIIIRSVQSIRGMAQPRLRALWRTVQIPSKVVVDLRCSFSSTSYNRLHTSTAPAPCSTPTTIVRPWPTTWPTRWARIILIRTITFRCHRSVHPY